MKLSAAARSVWAKTGRRDAALPEGRAPLTHWLPLYRHLADSAGMAARLWDEGFWAPAIRDRLTRRYGGDESAARAVTILLAENHDIGKASPAFAAQCPELTPPMGAEGLAVPRHIAENVDRSAVRHELVTYLAFDEWAATRGTAPIIRKQLASVLGSHHGRPLLPEQVRLVRERPLLAGEGAWVSVRREFLELTAADTRVAPALEKVLSTTLRRSDLVLLTGMLILTDWVASSEVYFPLYEVGTDPALPRDSRVGRAWSRFAPPDGWRPDPAPDDDALFSERFRLPRGASIHPAQRSLVDSARKTTEPKLLVLEAPMGSGKTEAALAAAEVLAKRSGANGLFVALPTQATTDAMFSRVRRWADSAGLGTSIFLAHGRSTLNDEFEDLRTDPEFNGIDTHDTVDGGSRLRRDGSVVAHRWFAGSKKGPLSNLVVGTIDQVLFLALQSRHVALRHLALAAKVVVIDEAHAFDVYMGEFLARAVQWLGAYGVPTIILSATLPADRRRELARAYEEGRLLDRGEQVRFRGRPVVAAEELQGDIGYPAVIVSGKPSQVSLPGWTGNEHQIALERMDDSPESLTGLIRTRLKSGGCLAVVRNTVSRAQETAALLRSKFPDTPVILAHSRFIAEDRARRDRTLLDLFGAPFRAERRPDRAIVVGTQVIEQSLDLDFDLMISDIAPIDLLLQRAGRLHRHTRPTDARPTALRTPCLVITGVDWSQSPPSPDRGACAVYGAHLLLRTLAELHGRESITLPRDISSMVQRVYSGFAYAKEGWEAALAEAEHRFAREQSEFRASAKPFRIDEVASDPESLMGWAAQSIGDAEHNDRERRGRAIVRRSGEDLEVFALFSDGNDITLAPWWHMGDLGRLPLNGVPDKALIRGILRSALRIPEHACRRYKHATVGGASLSGIDLLIQDLERVTMSDTRLHGLQGTRELKGELMLVFDKQGRCELPGAVFSYTEDDGLKVEQDD